MTVDRILVRLPKDFEYFLPAVSCVHEYIMQVQNQKKHFIVTVELGDESHLFFSSLFPRMEIQLAGDRPRSRWDWDVVLDYRTTDRAMGIAKATKKHVTEAWGVLFGGSPPRIPQLGYLGARVKREETDILIDSNVPQAERLKVYFQNPPVITIRVDQVNGLRPGTMFDKLCGTKMYIGKRSGATYLAATMGKKLVELYTNDLPSWWLAKPPSDRYKMIYGTEFSPELVWTIAEEIWTTSNTMSQGVITTDRQASTVEPVSVR